MKLATACILLTVSIHAEDWPQFRGGNASGVSSSKALPQSFSGENNIAWKVKVGDGIGSPVVKNGRVFTTAMLGDQKLGVFSFDATTGTEVTLDGAAGIEYSNDWQLSGGDVALVIGGPDGIEPAFRQAAHERIRLSDLTLPHAFARVLLIEQLYRAWSINANHPYHRE